uniref:Uncharacterized protein n=1 Tax=Arundo donax TaxID=35708 RepID=A0A0A8ZMJ0_ARUDO
MRTIIDCLIVLLCLLQTLTNLHQKFIPILQKLFHRGDRCLAGLI